MDTWGCGVPSCVSFVIVFPLSAFAIASWFAIIFSFYATYCFPFNCVFYLPYYSFD
jgi:hypothetical protein